MKTISNRRPINLKVVRFELDFSLPTSESLKPKKQQKAIEIPKQKIWRKKMNVPQPPQIRKTSQRVEDLIEELLDELYSDQRGWGCGRGDYTHRYSSSAGSLTSSISTREKTEAIEKSFLEGLELSDLRGMAEQCARRMRDEGARLARHLRTRDKLRRQQKRLNDGFTVLLRHASGDSSARFSVSPAPAGGGGAAGEGEGGFAQWLHAMRLVARLPAGVPHHFRKKLWLTLAERHLAVRGVDWPVAERASFRGTAHPDDSELGAQIVKDLHRTGCSLFCGTEGRENQAMLRRVLLAYARWNKDVGYCQGFNMLAAIILEVMDKSESDSLKVMIYLVEAVLPEGYFADDLRGLSADMAAFRDLLRIRLPRLAQHMDRLQRASDGGGVEPPLPDVFTMQWFLTLYATWLPRGALLRVWDLVFLDGNEVLLLTALAIWDLLQDRILSARSADEFYSCMGGGAGAVWEAGEALVARVVGLGEAPELPRLRDLHRYHVTPPAPPPPHHAPPVIHSAVQSVTRRGLKLFYSEDEGDSSDDGNKMALATVNVPRRADMSGGDRLSLDIGALKRQYARLRERQRQAHVILAAACARHAAVGIPTTPPSLTVNHLLLGKSAIVSSRGRRLGPPPGAVPPSRRPAQSRSSKARADDTINWKDEHHRKHITRRDSIKWKDLKRAKDDERKASLESDEAGDGVIVSELEAKEMMSAMRSRSMSESSSYSSRSGSASSTDTSLCDDQNRASDFDSEPPSLDDNAVNLAQIAETSNRSVQDLVRLSPIYSPNDPDMMSKEKDLIGIKSPENIETAEKVNQPEQFQITNENAKDETKKSDVDALSEFVSSTPGEQLRNYLEEFENRKNMEESLSDEPLRYTNTKSPLLDLDDTNSKMSSEVTSKSDSDIIGLRCSLKKDMIKTPEFHKNSPSPNHTSFTEVTPLDLTQSRYQFDYKSSYSDTYRLSNLLSDHSGTFSAQPRPPDIIDSLVMSPNFVPDIDLSDKNLSDIESPLRSPGGESIVISEDEPPIPLKIDKYFEHSPEFFGARKIAGMQSSDEDDIPNRRTQKRLSRLPKKPDSLMLQCNLNEKLQNKTECDPSLVKYESNYNPSKSGLDTSRNSSQEDKEYSSAKYDKQEGTSFSDSIEKDVLSKDSLEKIGILESGRRNSERALQIIQENSKILNRILTKQITAAPNPKDDIEGPSTVRKQEFENFKFPHHSIITGKIIESPVLKGSASDSLIKWDERPVAHHTERATPFMRLRPTSLDEPTSTAFLNALSLNKGTLPGAQMKKSPSSDAAIANRTDRYGWENKAFLAKCDSECDHIYKSDTETLNRAASPIYSDLYPNSSKSMAESKFDWSMDTFTKNKHIEDKSQGGVGYASTSRYQSKSVDPASDRYDYSLTSKYSDCLLSRASDICSRTLDRGPKVCENSSRGESSQGSDFAFVVTSSVSFSYEPSADDDSPTAAKSNSSDTLCQITSLDQISTPISPKIFPKDTPTPKEPPEKSTMSPDDTSSQITSLVDTEPMSSLSCPRSPSTGSYHPFPARPAIRMPKELGVRLGLYSRDSINSPSK